MSDQLHDFCQSKIITVRCSHSNCFDWMVMRSLWWWRDQREFKYIKALNRGCLCMNKCYSIAVMTTVIKLSLLLESHCADEYVMYYYYIIWCCVWYMIKSVKRMLVKTMEAHVCCKHCESVLKYNKHLSLSISLTPVKKPLNYNRGHF